MEFAELLSAMLSDEPDDPPLERALLQHFEWARAGWLRRVAGALSQRFFLLARTKAAQKIGPTCTRNHSGAPELRGRLRRPFRATPPDPVRGHLAA